MILVIDNYDSFTYNLVQYLGELGANLHIARNDEITIEEIEALEELQGGEASIREFLVKADNGLTGKVIAKLGLPEGCMVALINRGGEPLFPDEDEVLQGGDHLLVFTLKAQLPALEKLFR